MYNFLNDHSGKLSKKGPKSDLKSQFSMSKINGLFYRLLSLKNINLGAHFWPKICQILYHPYLKNSTIHITIFHSYYSSSESESSNSCLGNQYFRFLTFFSSKRCIAYLLAKFFVKSQVSLLDFCHLT